MFFPQKKVVVLGDKTKIELTEKEVDILKCLISSGEEIVDKDVMEASMELQLRCYYTYSETHIYRLRQKLEIDSSIPRLIISKGGGFTIRSLRTVLQSNAIVLTGD